MRKVLLSCVVLLVFNNGVASDLPSGDITSPPIINDGRRNDLGDVHRPRVIESPIIVIDDGLEEIVISCQKEIGLSHLIIQNLYTGETRVYEVSSSRDSVPVPNEPGVWMVSIEQNGLVLQNEVLFL